MTDPILSIVVAARNDNYGGGFLHRMQLFVDVLGAHLRQTPAVVELLVVEWNPPPSRPRLRDALTWPRDLRAGTVRLIEVPSAVHEQLPGSEKMPMYEYLAKNVGIRRARGRFVLATNPDLVYSRELVTAMTGTPLDDGAFYRIDRVDFRGVDLQSLVPEEAAATVARNAYVVHRRAEPGRRPSVPIGVMGRLKTRWTGRWPGSDSGNVGPGGPGPVVELREAERPCLHTNGAGDFLLTSRENWDRIRGFPEYTDTFTHLDSYACHQLRALGLRQLLFAPPCMVFHADHERTEQAARPRREQARWLGDLEDILEGRLGPAINTGDWGLSDRALTEDVIGEARP